MNAQMVIDTGQVECVPVAFSSTGVIAYIAVSEFVSENSTRCSEPAIHTSVLSDTNLRRCLCSHVIWYWLIIRPEGTIWAQEGGHRWSLWTCTASSFSFSGRCHRIAPGNILVVRALQRLRSHTVMLRSPVFVRRLTQMSVDSGQVSTALKSVLDKAQAAAQRSGKNTKVRHCIHNLYKAWTKGRRTSISWRCYCMDMFRHGMHTAVRCPIAAIGLTLCPY